MINIGALLVMLIVWLAYKDEERRMERREREAQEAEEKRKALDAGIDVNSVVVSVAPTKEDRYAYTELFNEGALDDGREAFQETHVRRARQARRARPSDRIRRDR